MVIIEKNMEGVDALLIKMGDLNAGCGGNAPVLDKNSVPPGIAGGEQDHILFFMRGQAFQFAGCCFLIAPAAFGAGHNTVFVRIV